MSQLKELLIKKAEKVIKTSDSDDFVVIVDCEERTGGVSFIIEGKYVDASFDRIMNAKNWNIQAYRMKVRPATTLEVMECSTES